MKRLSILYYRIVIYIELVYSWDRVTFVHIAIEHSTWQCNRKGNHKIEEIWDEVPRIGSEQLPFLLPIYFSISLFLASDNLFFSTIS